jgi:hypothetical protein
VNANGSPSEMTRYKLLGFALMLISALASACRRSPSAVDLDTELRRALPVGTSLENVDSYLKSHNVEHSFNTKDRRVYAIVRNLKRDAIGISESFSIVFGFSESNRLTKIETSTEYTGP